MATGQVIGNVPCLSAVTKIFEKFRMAHEDPMHEFIQDNKRTEKERRGKETGKVIGPAAWIQAKKKWLEKEKIKQTNMANKINQKCDFVTVNVVLLIPVTTSGFDVIVCVWAVLSLFPCFIGQST
ncbi:hypothetical protein OS493_007699 [Desmophyllum pertusum]|uniref:Uncharacterized protein n=1 Tax=Desmophyllum pertusum TaxID=174260 RepID=A0A9W9YRR6_9CNID|nr:hypothetical protein OS493_007699 [Desmophyllum pertusum]